MKLTLAVAALLCLTTFAFAEEGEDDAALRDVVALHYPAALSTFVQVHHLSERRFQEYAQIRTDKNRYIVAAYSNGHNGAVVLLERAKEGTYNVDQTLIGGFDGIKPEVTAVDLDGDNKPEVVVSFLLDRGADTTIYRINGKSLEAISPTTKSGGPALVYPALLDFSGNGVIDLVDETVGGPRDDRSVRYNHYVLHDGKYVAAAPLDFYKVFYRESGAPKPQTANFSVSPPLIGKPFNMTILNGAGSPDEKFRLNRASITLNGVKVTAGDFSKHRPAWTVPVMLQAENNLRVEFCRTGEGGEEDHDCDEHGRVAIAIRH